MRWASSGLLLLFAVAGALAGCASEHIQQDVPPRVIDLGHSLAATDPTWSGTPTFSRTAEATFDKDGYAAGRIDVLEHFGTHVDAPSHFARSGLTVDQLTTDVLIRPGVCINVSGKIPSHDDYAVTVDDIAAFETAHGRVPADTIVFIATGWDSRWPDAARYMNVRDGVKHFPGLSLEAATLLARDRLVTAIGIDTPSIDVGTSTTFEAHGFTMSAGVYHIENAARLTDLPATGFTVTVAPMKIAGGSGAPARVFAFLPAASFNR